MNKFRFIGTCYDDVHINRFKNGNEYQTVVVAVESECGKLNHIPLLIDPKLKEKADFFCKKGNVVAFSGEVKTKEVISKKDGTITIRVGFRVSELMLIRKIKRVDISEKKFAELIASQNID